MKIYQSNVLGNGRIFILFYYFLFFMQKYILFFFLLAFGFGFSCKNSEKCSNLVKSIKLRYMKYKDDFKLDDYKLQIDITFIVNQLIHHHCRYEFLS